jgi:hypothetical protein
MDHSLLLWPVYRHGRHELQSLPVVGPGHGPVFSNFLKFSAQNDTLLILYAKFLALSLLTS